MSAGNFDRALALVLKHEGGYVDHPSDPGGATNMGITHHTLAGWRGRPVTKADVRALTRAEAALIYRRSYWDTVSGDRLPAGLDYALFDFAVNSGSGRAVRFLQDIVGAPQDGRIGAVTLGKVSSLSPSLMVRELCDDRLRWLKRLDTWPTFGRGWERRVTEVRREALVMAAALPPDVPLPEAPTSGVVPPSSPAREGGLRQLVAAIIDLLARLFRALTRRRKP